jgi:hypothetical protein
MNEADDELLDLWTEFSGERFAAGFITVGPDTALAFAGWLAKKRGAFLRGKAGAGPGGVVPGWGGWDMYGSLTLLASVKSPRRSPELDPWLWRPHFNTGWTSDHGPVVVDCGIALRGSDEIRPGETLKAWVRWFHAEWAIALDLRVGSEFDLYEGGVTKVASFRVESIT